MPRRAHRRQDEYVLARLHRAATVAEAREALGMVGKMAPRMPIAALALFLTGVWLTVQRWTWGTPWIGVAILGLVLMLVMGGAVLRPQFGKLRAVLAQAPEGPMTPDAIAARRRPVIWVASHMQPAIVLGIMFLMVTKPERPMALVDLGVFIALGAISAIPFTR